MTRNLRYKLSEAYHIYSRSFNPESEALLTLNRIRMVGSNSGYSHEKRVKMMDELAEKVSFKNDEEKKAFDAARMQLYTSYAGYIKETNHRRDNGKLKLKRQVKNRLEVIKEISHIKRKIDRSAGGFNYLEKAVEEHKKRREEYIPAIHEKVLAQKAETSKEAWKIKLKQLKEIKTRGSSIACAALGLFEDEENARRFLGSEVVNGYLKIEEIKAEQKERDRVLGVRVGLGAIATAAASILVLSQIGAYGFLNGLGTKISSIKDTFFYNRAEASEQDNTPIAHNKTTARTTAPKLVDVNYPAGIYSTINNQREEVDFSGELQAYLVERTRKSKR